MPWHTPFLVGAAIAILLALAFSVDYAVRSPHPTVGNGQPGGIVLNEVEVSKHGSASDCWMVIGATVVDVTAFIQKHPGGSGTLTAYCGKDGTAAFLNQGGLGSHSAAASKQLEYLTLGRLGSHMDPSAPAKVRTFVDSNPQLFTEGE